MMFDVAGKVALVTGGASGLGRQIVRVFLQENAKGVVFIDINKDKGKETENVFAEQFGSDRCIFVKADVTEEEEMKAAFEQVIKMFTQLDIVINNAGIVDDLDWKKSICCNLGGCMIGTMLGIDEFLPKYKHGKEGIIVNVGSIMGIVPSGMCPIYSAAKHGIVALSRNYGQDEHYERTKVKVIALCPGFMVCLENPPDFSTAFNMEYCKAFNLTEREFPIQTPAFVAESLPDILKIAGNGTVWVVEAGEAPYEVNFPNLRKDPPVLSLKNDL